MASKGKILLAIALILLVAFGIFLYFYNNQRESFSVKTFLLKLNIPIGGESIYKVKIVNNENIERVFSVYLDNLENIAYLSDTEFSLKPNEGREISVYVKDQKSKVGVYPGKLIISDNSFTKEIPVIIILEDIKTVLSVITSEIPDYHQVSPGGKLGVEIKLYDLDEISVPSARAKYSIKNLEGDILWSDEGDLVVDGSKTEIVDIPKNWPIGDYVFIVSMEYKGTNAISGYFFSLSRKSNNFFGNFNSNLILLVLVFFVFMLVFIMLLFYLIKSRDDFLMQLRRQQNGELSRNIQLIESSKKKIEKTIPAPSERKIKIQKLERIKKKVIKQIKKKHAIQGKELKKLRKQAHKIKLVRPKKELMVEKKKPAVKLRERYKLKEKARPKPVKREKKRAGPAISSNEYRKKIEEQIRRQKINEIRNKLGSWKKQGYKLSETEKEINKIANSRQIENWKR